MSSNKAITYPSGTIVRRKINGNEEVWELEGKSLSISTFQLDLSNCDNITFADDPDEDFKEVRVGCLEKRDMFRIKKSPPYVFAPQFKLIEDPIPLEDQKKHTKDETDKIEEIISKIEDSFKTMPFEVMNEKELKKAFKKLGVDHFVDPHFPPRDSSIHCITDPYPYKQIIHWRRPHEFMKNPKIFEDGVNPNDIKQGHLPNCWFLSALSSLAERPALVQRLILTKKYNKEGIYKVRLCKNGEWQTITVDDYIPCYFKGGPMFARGNGDELWVMLLEKAYAKMHGCYYSLRYGFTHHGMLDITGCPTINIKFPEEKPDYETVEEKAEEIWDKVLGADEKGYLISGETPGFDTATEGGNQDAPSGLVAGHAYSIIQAKEGLGVKLLNIRNPWGKYEWDGAWADNSEEWTEEMIEEFNPEFNPEDGSFWMCLEDFIMRFDSVNICEVDNWNEVRLKGKYIRVKEEEGEENEWVVPKFYYTFDIEEDDTVIHIGIHQEDDRVVGADRRRLLDVFFILLRIDEDTDELEVVETPEPAVERELQMKYELDEGSYILVPLTTGGLLQKPRNASNEDIEYSIVFDEIKMPHPFFLMTLNDIFRKIDLKLDGRLSADELNQFGKIIEENKLQNITPNSFSSKKFKELSCDKNGLTNLGFKQFLFRNFDQKRLEEILETLGYDRGLYSFKSKIFVTSFQADADINVKINESFVGDLHQRAWDLYIHHKFENKEYSHDYVSSRSGVFFRIDHNEAYGCSYGYANNTNNWMRIQLDMTDSHGCYFTPKDGTSNVIVPPKSLKYIGSCISDPECEDFSYARSYTLEKAEAPENDSEDEDEGENSESEGSDSEGGSEGGSDSEENSGESGDSEESKDSS